MFSHTPLISALFSWIKISSDLFSDQVQLTLALKMKHSFSKRFGETTRTEKMYFKRRNHPS